jgi:hypothetical protein
MGLNERELTNLSRRISFQWGSGRRDVYKIGFYPCWVAVHEPRMRRYVSSEVLDWLKQNVPSKFMYFRCPEADEMIRKDIPLGSAYLAERLYVSQRSVTRRASERLGLHVPNEETYTEFQLDIIRKMVDEGLSDKSIGLRIGRSRNAVRIKRRRSGLFKRGHLFRWANHPAVLHDLVSMAGEGIHYKEITRTMKM